jgi:hypothetical protein
MLRSLARRFRLIFDPSVARLESRAARTPCSVQARTEPDEANLRFPLNFATPSAAFIRPENAGLCAAAPPGSRPFRQAHLAAPRKRRRANPRCLGWAGGSLRIIRPLGSPLVSGPSFPPAGYLRGIRGLRSKGRIVAVGFNEELSFPATSVEPVPQNIQPIGDPLAVEPG